MNPTHIRALAQKVIDNYAADMSGLDEAQVAALTELGDGAREILEMCDAVPPEIGLMSTRKQALIATQRSNLEHLVGNEEPCAAQTRAAIETTIELLTSEGTLDELASAAAKAQAQATAAAWSSAQAAESAWTAWSGAQEASLAVAESVWLAKYRI